MYVSTGVCGVSCAGDRACSFQGGSVVLQEFTRAPSLSVPTSSGDVLGSTFMSICLSMSIDRRVTVGVCSTTGCIIQRIRPSWELNCSLSLSLPALHGVLLCLCGLFVAFLGLLITYSLTRHCPHASFPLSDGRSSVRTSWRCYRGGS